MIDEDVRRESNARTEEAYLDLWRSNATANLDLIRTLPTVLELADRFARVPAVVVAPGPSLDLNLHELGAAFYVTNSPPVVIASAQAIGPLSLVGLTPDLAVVATGQDVSGCFDAMRLAPWGGAIVASATAHPSIHALGGRRFLFSCNGEADEWLLEHRPDLPTLYSGGSVSTVALSLAHGMGCDPIILVGYDLAYSGDRRYAEGVVAETDAELLFNVPANDGGWLKAPADFLLHRAWLGEAIEAMQAQGRTVINATEGGAVIPGAARMELRHAITSLGTRHANPRAIISAAYEDGRLP